MLGVVLDEVGRLVVEVERLGAYEELVAMHRTFWKIEMAKYIQSIWRLLRERPHPGLQNEPPVDPQSPNPFIASPSPDPIQKGLRE